MPGLRAKSTSTKERHDALSSQKSTLYPAHVLPNVRSSGTFLRPAFTAHLCACCYGEKCAAKSCLDNYYDLSYNSRQMVVKTTFRDDPLMDKKAMKEILAILNDSLGFNIDRVAKLFRQELTRALADYDLTPEQWQIMVVIWNSDTPLNQQNITQFTLKDKHNVSRLVKRLEVKGWLEKRPNPDDARAFLLTATQKGQTQRDVVVTTLLNHFEKMELGLTKEEQVHLLSLLKTIRTHLNDD
jgi:DNA-binding MarR family transcriptional regulator